MCDLLMLREMLLLCFFDFVAKSRAGFSDVRRVGVWRCCLFFILDVRIHEASILSLENICWKVECGERGKDSLRAWENLDGLRRSSSPQALLLTFELEVRFDDMEVAFNFLISDIENSSVPQSFCSMAMNR